MKRHSQMGTLAIRALRFEGQVSDLPLFYLGIFQVNLKVVREILCYKKNQEPQTGSWLICADGILYQALVASI